MTQNTPIPQKSNRVLTAVLTGACLLLLLLFVMVSFTFLHESGHLLMGLLFGAEVTSFSINFINFSAHVGLDGTFSPWQNGLISAAGVSFPLLLWAAFITLVPRKGTLLLEYLKLVLSMAIVNALLAWIIIPILGMSGQVIGDDSANFVRHTQFSPILVSAAALLVYLGALALFFNRAGGLKTLVQNLRGQPLELSSPQARATLAGMLVCGAVFAAAAFGLGQAVGTTRQAAIPAGYEQVGSYDLSQTSFADTIVYKFELKSPNLVSLFFTLTDIQGAPLMIHLTGPDGYDNVFFAADDSSYKAIGMATVHPQDLALKPGEYHIRLTFPPGMGKIAIYMKN